MKVKFYLNGLKVKEKVKNYIRGRVEKLQKYFKDQSVAVEMEIEKDKRGREVEIKITEKGQEIIDLLRKFEEIGKREIKLQEVKNGNKNIVLFCVKCKEKVEVFDPELTETKSSRGSRKAVKGTCINCGNKSICNT